MKWISYRQNPKETPWLASALADPPGQLHTDKPHITPLGSGIEGKQVYLHQYFIPLQWIETKTFKFYKILFNKNQISLVEIVLKAFNVSINEKLLNLLRLLQTGRIRFTSIYYKENGLFRVWESFVLFDESF